MSSYSDNIRFLEQETIPSTLWGSVSINYKIGGITLKIIRKGQRSKEAGKATYDVNRLTEEQAVMLAHDAVQEMIRLMKPVELNISDRLLALESSNNSKPKDITVPIKDDVNGWT